MASKELTLADLMAALTAQAGKLDTQYAEVQGSFAGVREEIAGCVDRVLKEAKAHVEVECQRVKSEVFSEVYTRDEVKIEVDKVTCDLKKYVDEVIAERAVPFPGQGRHTQSRVKNELVSGNEGEDGEASD